MASLDPQESPPVAQFAQACERMNDFARSLRESGRFHEVRAGADIRSYRNGWRMEKWVEARLHSKEELWAAWWLEIGPRPDGWMIESSVAVSPDIFHDGLNDRIANTPDELTKQLSAAVEELQSALRQRNGFADAVDKRLGRE